MMDETTINGFGGTLSDSPEDLMHGGGATVVHAGNIDTGALADQGLRKGATVLGLYQVLSDPLEGGMGRVFRVHHKGWGADLACKQPKAEVFRTEEQKRAFTHECEEWVKLGLHPHIVSCYYVRKIDGIPAAFSEWMEGGSLADWLEEERPSAESGQERLGIILDFAIQAARGLRYAHGNGLIHQDVKPANLLLTGDGTVKVTDFGIARSLSETASCAADDSSSDAVLVGGAYTPAYCAPEQMSQQAITQRTDIWCWAVTVLEMLLGERVWPNGVVAGFACDEYFAMMRTPLPPALEDLLRACFRESEQDRLQDFATIEAKLLPLYAEVAGTAYARPEPKAAADTAGSLNNRALSYLDLDLGFQALACWGQALEADPNHIESVFNRSLHSWREGLIDDREALHAVQNAAEHATPEAGAYFTALIHLERGDAKRARAALASAQPPSVRAQEALYQADAMTAGGECLAEYPSGLFDTQACALSPDNRQVALGCRGGELVVLEAFTGEVAFRAIVCERDVSCLAYLPDGTGIVVGDEGGAIRLVCAQDGSVLFSYSGHDRRVRDIEMLADGSFFTVGDDKAVMLSKPGTGACYGFYRTEGIAPQEISASADGGWFVVVGSDDAAQGAIRVWNASTKESVEIPSPMTSVWHASMAGDGSAFAASAHSSATGLWDVATKEKLVVFPVEADMVANQVHIEPGGKRVITMGGNILALWDRETGRRLFTYLDFEGTMHCCFSNDGAYIYTSDVLYGDKLWSVPPEGKAAAYAVSRISTVDESLGNEDAFAEHLSIARCCLDLGRVDGCLKGLADAYAVPGFEASPAAADLSREVGRFCRISGLRTFRAAGVLARSGERFDSVAFSPNGKLVVTGGPPSSKGEEQKQVALWDVASGECLARFEAGHRVAGSVSFSPDGRFIVAATWGGEIYVWEVETKALRHVLYAPVEGAFIDIAFSSAGSILASLSRESGLQLWDIEQGTCAYSVEVADPSLHALTLSADASTMVFSSGSDIMCMGNDGLHILQAKGTMVTALDISADAKHVLAGEDGGVIRHWDAEAGECTLEVQAYGKGLSSVALSPDGRFAASGGHDADGHAVKLWDLSTGACLGVLSGHEDYIRCVTFSRDGTRIASASSDATVRLWDVGYLYDFPGWADWDAGAEPIVRMFAVANPRWENHAFDRLIALLQSAGYGWLRPESVRERVKNMVQ